MGVPITILSGFLGAGKTTLINHFIRQNLNVPIAIVENEFAPNGIDGVLLESRIGIEILEISNGCVCCNMRGAFANGIIELLEKRDTGEINFEHIIIETTGLADPSPIVQTFFIDENLREKTRLDACIVVVDSAHIERQLKEHNVAVAQIAMADRILLTKSDRIEEGYKQKILKRLNKINATAQIVEVINGICASDLWLNVHGFELSEDLDITRGNFSLGRQQKTKFSSFTAQAVQPSSWNDNIKSFYFEMACFDINLLGHFMEKLVEDYGHDMFRYKGIFAIAEEERRLIVQGVHKVVAFDYGSLWNEEKPLSKFVIIARTLDENWLRQKLASCLA